MTLSFKQKINGKPTHFVEKIWESIFQSSIVVKVDDFIKYGSQCEQLKDYTVGTHPPKIHSIREDKTNRWSANRNIHFVINNRTPKRYQFTPIIPCISTQKIEIKNLFKDRIIIVDGRIISKKEMGKLAINDGFDTEDDFWNYFEQADFKGKIIHWTNRKY